MSIKCSRLGASNLPNNLLYSRYMRCKQTAIPAARRASEIKRGNYIPMDEKDDIK
ncbi:MAG: hypothetical protein QXS27_02875 [Candidatus Jordarchaeaceae archaeon]